MRFTELFAKVVLRCADRLSTACRDFFLFANLCNLEKSLVKLDILLYGPTYLLTYLAKEHLVNA